MYKPYRARHLGRHTLTRAELAASDEASSHLRAAMPAMSVYASYRKPAAYLYELSVEPLTAISFSQDDFQDGDAGRLGGPTRAARLLWQASGTQRFYRQTNTTGNAAALWPSLNGSNDQSIQADITPRAFDGADRWFGLVTCSATPTTITT